MGLTIAVGLLAQNLKNGDPEDRTVVEEPFALLNEVLTEQRLPLHHEPTDISDADYFEAAMWGYGGLHALRRFAAYVALHGDLPASAMPYGKDNEDEVLRRFLQLHDSYVATRKRKKFLGLFGGPAQRPKFQHLIYHSDAEGFYLPRAFDEVVIDYTQPERAGLGIMIGSAATLLGECEVLAEKMELPDDFDPDADDFLECLESSLPLGLPWQVHATAAHSLANLRSACRVSVRLGAALQFC